MIGILITIIHLELVGNYQGTSLQQFECLGPAVNADANSYDYNPNYIFYNRSNDHSKTIEWSWYQCRKRNRRYRRRTKKSSAPDVGAQEISADFGLTQLLRPTLDCYHTDNEFVEIVLRQYGDLPLSTSRWPIK